MICSDSDSVGFKPWCLIKVYGRGVFYLFGLFAGDLPGPLCENIVPERPGTETGGERPGDTLICVLDLSSLFRSPDITSFIRPQGVNSGCETRSRRFSLALV